MALINKLLKLGIMQIPTEVDSKVGFLKLQAIGVEIDKLTEEQNSYIHGYEEAT